MSGGVLIQATAPSRGRQLALERQVRLRSRRSEARSVAGASLAFAVLPGKASSKACSRRFVRLDDSCVSTPVSQPSAMAATAASTATPRPRRIHSPAPRELLSAANTRPPISDGERERNDRAQRVGKEQDRRLRARAADRGAGQDQAEDRPCAGRREIPSRRRAARIAPRPGHCGCLRPARCDCQKATKGRDRYSAARRESSATPKQGEHDERDRASRAS